MKERWVAGLRGPARLFDPRSVFCAYLSFGLLCLILPLIFARTGLTLLLLLFV